MQEKFRNKPIVTFFFLSSHNYVTWELFNLFIKHMLCTTNPSLAIQVLHACQELRQNIPTDMFEDTFISGAFTKYRYNLYGFANHELTI